jgi:hypothetical protein
VGKVGGLKKDHIPNQTLATGNNSFLDSEYIQWDNLFDFAKEEEQVVVGDQYTIPSVLNETKHWLKMQKAYSFVDSEIGFMAKAALAEKIAFSYLHIISDNLHKGFGEDLSNERAVEVQEKRKALLKKAKVIIETGIEQL